MVGTADAFSLFKHFNPGQSLPARAAFPEKPVRYIIAFAPGGESDIAARFQQGKTDAADVLRQKVLLEQNRVALAGYESNISVLEHALAALLGGLPDFARADHVFLVQDRDQPGTVVSGDSLERLTGATLKD